MLQIPIDHMEICKEKKHRLSSGVQRRQVRCLREVPKALVTLLNYIREDIDGSERDFHDPYVKRFQKFIHEVKSKDGGTLYGF